MSAWIVTRAQIDALVLAGIQFRVPFDASAPAGRVLIRAELSAVGAALWAENHRSVNHRYDQDTAVPDYTATLPEVLLDPVAVVKLVACFAYQSCEHPGWETSASADYCTRLREAAIAGLPLEPPVHGSLRYPVGWDSRPWCFDDIVEIAVTPVGPVARAGAAGPGGRSRRPRAPR